MVTFGWHGIEAAEEAMALGVWSCGEVEGLWLAGAAAVAKGQPPKAVNHDGSIIRVAEQAVEFSSHRIEAHDGAAAEIADQKLAGVLAECARRQRDPPRRVDLAQLPARVRTCDQARKGLGLRVERVDEPVSGAWNIIMLLIILLGEGDIDGPANIGDIEWGITCWGVWIRVNMLISLCWNSLAVSFPRVPIGSV